MDRPLSLYRAEALRHYVSREEEVPVLRVPSGRSFVALWVVIALVIMATVATVLSLPTRRVVPAVVTVLPAADPASPMDSSRLGVYVLVPTSVAREIVASGSTAVRAEDDTTVYRAVTVGIFDLSVARAVANSRGIRSLRLPARQAHSTVAVLLRSVGEPSFSTAWLAMPDVSLLLRWSPSPGAAAPTSEAPRHEAVPSSAFR